ncbi:MAG: hypothetical protein KC492_12285, partial [Myxococcales bacterium]|nr:hypothetical protein [Myxococcales bacterium]
CEPIAQMQGYTQTLCESDTTTLYSNSWSLFDTAIAQGRVGFNASQFSQCLSAYATADCDQGLAVNGPCSRIFNHSRPMGYGCHLQTECNAGLMCVSSGGGGNCGTCESRAAQGYTCDTALCEESLRCWDALDQSMQQIQICLPEAGVGANCTDPNVSGFCGGELACRGGVCVRPQKVAGSSCDPASDTLAPCDINQGLLCVNSLCTQVSFGALGATCDTAAPATRYCRYGLYCNAGFCDNLPSSGSCISQRCAPGYFCDSFGSCQAEKSAGANCSSDDECEIGLLCRNGTCGGFVFNSCP